jgi:hypothetical protein
MPPGVILCQPCIVVAEGNSEVLVGVMGPNIAANNPAATLMETPGQLAKPRDVELLPMLDRKALDFDASRYLAGNAAT